MACKRHARHGEMFAQMFTVTTLNLSDADYDKRGAP